MSLPFLFHSQTVDGLAFDGKRVKVCLKTEALTFDAVYVRIEPDNEEYLVAMVQCGRAGSYCCGKYRSSRIEIETSPTMYLKSLEMVSNIG